MRNANLSRPECERRVWKYSKLIPMDYERCSHVKTPAETKWLVKSWWVQVKNSKQKSGQLEIRVRGPDVFEMGCCWLRNVFEYKNASRNEVGDQKLTDMGQKFEMWIQGVENAIGASGGVRNWCIVTPEGFRVQNTWLERHEWLCFRVQKHGLGKANGRKLMAVAQKSENTTQANRMVVNAIQWSETIRKWFLSNKEGFWVEEHLDSCRSKMRNANLGSQSWVPVVGNASKWSETARHRSLLLNELFRNDIASKNMKSQAKVIKRVKMQWWGEKNYNKSKKGRTNVVKTFENCIS